MDRCLKDKAHFIIAQTIWNNKNGKAVFAEQVFDRCQKKFQDEINRELYKLIEEGGGGGTGKDGKTPVFETGTITTLAPDQPATCTITKTGDDPQGNPIYRVDVGIPKGDTGAPGDTPSLDGYATETWVTTQINNTIGTINSALDEINGEVV